VTEDRFPTSADSFPRQHARTRRFSLGAPGRFSIAADGSKVAFLRSRAGDDPVGCLWLLDVATGEERLVFDSQELAAEAEAHLSHEERDRRERARETLTGVTAYAADRELRIASLVVGGGILVAFLETGETRAFVSAPAPFDPRPDPTGRHVAYVSGGTLHAIDLADHTDVILAGDPDPDVHWGLAEFVAAEEMERDRGFWWAPDGEQLIAACVDERPVRIWYLASQIDPAAPPRAVRYPQAGTDDAIVTLSIFSAAGGSQIDVTWDRDAFPYVVRAGWDDHGPFAFVMSRSQQRAEVLRIDPATGATSAVHVAKGRTWLHVVDGVPAWLGDGRLVMTRDEPETRRLTIENEPVTPAGLQVVRVLDVSDDDVLFVGTEEPTERHVWRWSEASGSERVTDEAGVHSAARGGGTIVIAAATLGSELPVATVRCEDGRSFPIASHAERPLLTPAPSLLRLGERALRAAVLTPGGGDPTEPLPVLLDPYGGPHYNKVRASRTAFLESQWFADQGFAVLVADGRGTEDRGPAWEWEIHENIADVVLRDQVDALHAVAERSPFVDLDRVAIRGWSFGGYLAALAVLRRPDVFHAAVAGAPVTDMHLYDTFYTERYLGHPAQNPEVYERNSLLADASKLDRPLLLIHGLADDNVYVANTLRLSQALTEAGRPHAVLPLSGITHAPSKEEVAENLLLLQVRFLKDALGIAAKD
jgi:dipeptidyl-peptidase 4